jgi:hypothetical protein
MIKSCVSAWHQIIETKTPIRKQLTSWQVTASNLANSDSSQGDAPSPSRKSYSPFNHPLVAGITWLQTSHHQRQVITMVTREVPNDRLPWWLHSNYLSFCLAWHGGMWLWKMINSNDAGLRFRCWQDWDSNSSVYKPWQSCRNAWVAFSWASWSIKFIYNIIMRLSYFVSKLAGTETVKAKTSWN